MKAINENDLTTSLLRVFARCEGGHHTKADHSDVACFRCRGSLVDLKKAKRLRPKIEAAIREAQTPAPDLEGVLEIIDRHCNDAVEEYGAGSHSDLLVQLREEVRAHLRGEKDG